MYFWSLICKRKVTCMPIVCFIFWLFTANVFLYNSFHSYNVFSVLKSWLMNAHSHPNRVSKWTHNFLKKWSQFDKRMFFSMIIFWDEVTFMPVACLLFRFLQLVSCDIRMNISILTVVQNECINRQKKQS